MIHNDRQWYTVIHNDTQWQTDTVIHSDTQWYTMIDSDTQWYTMTHNDRQWYTMIQNVHNDTQWYTMIQIVHNDTEFLTFSHPNASLLNDVNFSDKSFHLWFSVNDLDWDFRTGTRFTGLQIFKIKYYKSSKRPIFSPYLRRVVQTIQSSKKCKRQIYDSIKIEKKCVYLCKLVWSSFGWMFMHTSNEELSSQRAPLNRPRRRILKKNTWN